MSEARDKISRGTADYAGHKAGLACVIECRVANSRARTADLWVKDRGVKGGKYGRPYEPNGTVLEDGMFCGGAQFHLAHQ